MELHGAGRREPWERGWTWEGCVQCIESRWHNSYNQGIRHTDHKLWNICDALFSERANTELQTFWYFYSRLQNSPYSCVFKYARAVKQKVWNDAENSVRLARELRARKTHTPRFTDFFTDFEKNPSVCSLFLLSHTNSEKICIKICDCFWQHWFKLSNERRSRLRQRLSRSLPSQRRSLVR